ncbi:hypothetical protein LCGC14_1317000 [marine sediment metagenome]|uniref:Uncharacterized protein n=1 Tax=marine sediment metagenome TaxID=412755 RepID=A0A0F9KL44_9ZZZZ
MKIVIVWDDGTKTETEIHPPKVTEKVFEPIVIHNGCFVISVDSENNIKVATGPDYYGYCCCQTLDVTRKFICALEEAMNFVENK